MTYITWFFLLIIQNMSFTWISRARNSGSYSYHAVAALCSNGIYIITFFLTIGNVLQTVRRGSWIYAVLIVLTYTTACTIGSVLMHYISMEYLEVGRRKVGAKLSDSPVASSAGSYKSELPRQG